MEQIVSALQMRQIEDKSEEFGVSKEDLMDNAGERVFKYILDKVGLAGRNIIFFAGKGNNGGDALVAAVHAYNSGAQVVVVMVEGYPKSSATQKRIEEVKALGIKTLTAQFNESEIEAALGCVDIIVDGVYGTGFKGELSVEIKLLFEKINSAVAAVFSIDIPSGIEADSGRLAKSHIHADFTLALDSAKHCHILPTSVPSCGVIEVLDISVPDKARKGNYNICSVVNRDMAINALPIRSDYDYKYSFGRVLNISGCKNYLGAAVLSSQGALWSGAGYVTLMSSDCVCSNAAMHIPEITHIQIDSTEDGCPDLIRLPSPKLLSDNTDVVLIGCGLGKSHGVYELIHHLVHNRTKPIVIDADGINALAGRISLLKEAKCPVIITPHYSELAKILGCTVSAVEENPTALASALAFSAKITVVLKGANTVVASKDRTAFIYNGANSGMSKAGSGDLLAGMIAGILAQGADCKSAAISSVYIHGEAGKNCAKKLSAHTMQPSDLKHGIGEFFLSMQNEG